MTTPARARYTGYRFPAEIIGHALWLYFRFLLGLCMVEELLAARGIIVSHETVRQWARKFGQQFANRIRRRLPRVGDKWHLDEVVLKIAGVNHWLWRAVAPLGAMGANLGWPCYCHRWSCGLSDGLATATAEPRKGLVLETASRA
jgi:putative transposase